MAAPPSPLKTSVEPLEGNKVRLRVGIPSAEFEKAIDAAFRKLAREVKVPGFRPGKAPRRLLEARFGTEVAREQALRDSLPDFYAQAVEAEDIDVIAAPEIDITAGEEEGDVEFDAVVEVRPVVELHGYDSLRIEIPDPTVPEEAVDAQIDALRERFADLEDSNAPLTDGNYAEIDIKGYVHDDVIDALTATDFLYEVGSGSLVPELDTELRGKRTGDILKFNAVLDDRFGDRSGQEVAFQVLVKGAKRKVLPAADDEWASEASEFDTIADLRADVRRRLELVGRVQGQMALRDKVLEAVAALVDVDIPDALVGQEMEHRLHDLVHRLEHQGVTLTQYLAATGQDQEAFVAAVREGATEAVRADLALRAVVAQEAIEATDEEMDAEIARLAERVGQKPEKVRRDLGKRGALEAVRSDLARGKALQFLVDHATAVDENGNPVDLTLPPGEAAAEPGGVAEAEEVTGAADVDTPETTAETSPTTTTETSETPDDRDQQEPQA
ncbi:MAG TPA: trigger factor [Acidimicrobiia bacterium]|nr:trigger factor [Acidimicrobiia bacterium]